ncbi:MAG TPA: flagellar biosynthesis protein FlgE, partial [Lachnospiraceae bacterium]|nr:flagellar biosynthesis protein FlgE [Lachnospiraceae bacterium]
MMRSMYSGVAGLKAHQTKMDVIGNNIANVNTVGFKSSTVTFSDVLYQTTQSASGPNADTGAAGKNAMQIGLGSVVNGITTNASVAGGTQTTDNPFDVMINGDGFFIVNQGGTNYFTKAGAFKIDAAGTLCTSGGATV